MNHLIGAQVASFTDLLLDAVCIVDAGGRFLFVSAAGERIFGYTQQEMEGMAVFDLVAPEDHARTRAAAEAVLRGQSHTDFENRYVRKDGSVVHIMWSARWSEADQVRVAVARDVTQLKQAQAMQAALYALSEAAQASDDLPGLFRRSHDIIGELLPASGFAVALPGAPGQPMHFVYHVGDAAHTLRLHALCEQVFDSASPRHLPADADGSASGSMLAVPLSTSQGPVGVLALHAGNGHVSYTDQERNLLLFVSNQFAAAIERKQLQARMHFMAMHDELTRLPNRRLLHDRLHTAMARARRLGATLALLFIDLDRFKQVNDMHGHQAGDRLLLQVAQRIATCLRASDTLARLGGDEFIVLLENVALPADVMPVLDKIRDALAAPFDLGDGVVLPASASIGVAHYPEHGASIQELMSHADVAMYRAKEASAGAARPLADAASGLP